MKLLFIINHSSGNNTTDWQSLIEDHFKQTIFEIRIISLDDSCSEELVKIQIADFKPQRVVAVGGDGTVKFAASCLLKTGLPLGIVPAGSANGMAKELGIPTDGQKALELAINGPSRSIHV